MGAGNPKLKSWDNTLFEPRTYLIDFTEEGDSDDCVLFDMRFDDLIADIETTLDMIDVRRGGEIHSDLSYGFREGGIILLEDDLAQLICGTDGGADCTPLAVIPSFTFEDIKDEMDSKHYHKEVWYESRGLSFEDRLYDLTSKEYAKRLVRFKKRGKKILNLLYTHYRGKMSVRCSAYTSGLVSSTNLEC